MTKIKASTQYNKIYSDNSDKNPISFLKIIKNKIISIKSSNDNNKKYSLISVIISCFIETGKSLITRSEIFEFVKNEVMNNPNKIISTHKFKKIKNDMVTEKNYLTKLYQSLSKNKIFKKILCDDKKNIGYELNYEFMNKRKYILYHEMFDEYLPKQNQGKRRKMIKFENSLSVIKSKKPKILKNIELKKVSQEKEQKNNTTFEIDTSTFSIKESEIKVKKSEEPSINYSNSNLMESIKQLDSKKMDFIDINNYIPKTSTATKNKDIDDVSSNENSLIMPLFNDVIFNDKNLKYKNLNKENSKGECSNTLKEINIIINKGEEFLSLLKNPQLLNLLNSNGNYKKLGTSLLSLQKDSYAHNLLKAASDNYTELCKYLDYFLYERKNECDSCDTESDIKLIKIKCGLIISSIITKLSQFLLEYNYLVEIIEEIFDYERNFILKEMLKIINNDKSILSKDNVDCLENLLKMELNNAITAQE